MGMKFKKMIPANGILCFHWPTGKNLGKENKLELQSWFHLNAVFLVGFFSPLVFLNTFVFRDASSFLQLGISPTFEPWTVSLPPAQG